MTTTNRTRPMTEHTSMGKHKGKGQGEPSCLQIDGRKSADKTHWVETVNGNRLCDRFHTIGVGCSNRICKFAHTCPIRLPDGRACAKSHTACRHVKEAGVCSGLQIDYNHRDSSRIKDAHPHSEAAERPLKNPKSAMPYPSLDPDQTVQPSDK